MEKKDRVLRHIRNRLKQLKRVERALMMPFAALHEPEWYLGAQMATRRERLDLGILYKAISDLWEGEDGDRDLG